MKVQLFIPCLVQDLLPEIGEATARVLARAGVEPVYPAGQTCCGQAQFKAGRPDLVRPLAARFLDVFAENIPTVVPSGSCAHMIRRYPELFPDDRGLRQRAKTLAGRTYELSEFLVNVLGLDDLGAAYPATAVYHDSCQVGRALGLSEPPLRLLSRVRGLRLVPLTRPERCCGFGGAFSLKFPAVSEAILDEKIEDVLTSGANLVISAEVSCLLNIGGALKKAGAPVAALHLAQVLAGEGD